MYEQYSHFDSHILLQFALFQNAPLVFSIPWLVTETSLESYFHTSAFFSKILPFRKRGVGREGGGGMGTSPGPSDSILGILDQ